MVSFVNSLSWFVTSYWITPRLHFGIHYPSALACNVILSHDADLFYLCFISTSI